MAKSITKNAIFKSILNICNIIIPIIVGPYILRVLDRSYYDLYNSVNSVFQFFLIFGALGIYNYGVREISKKIGDAEESNRFYTELFIIGVISNIVVAAAYLGFSFITEKESLTRIICCVLSVQFFGNIFNFEWVNEANENYLFIALKSIAIKIVYFVLIFVLVRKCDDVIAYIGLLSGSMVLNTLVSFVYIKKNYKFTFVGLKFKRHILPILYTFIIVNIMLLYAQCDKLMLKYFVGESSVTAYQISQYISSLCYSIVIAVITVAIPKFANLFAQDKKDEVAALHQSVSNVFYMFMIPITIGVVFLSKEIIALYGGEKYSDCVEPLMVYAVLQLVSSIHYIIGDAYFYVSGHEKLLLLINGSGGILNIAINFILVACMAFTATTAAISMLGIYFLVGVVDIIVCRKKLDYKFSLFNRHTFTYIGCSLLFIPIIMLMRLAELPVLIHTLICFVLCVVVYAVLLFVFKDVYFKSTVTKFFAKFKRKKENEEERE